MVNFNKILLDKHVSKTISKRAEKHLGDMLKTQHTYTSGEYLAVGEGTSELREFEVLCRVHPQTLEVDEKVLISFGGYSEFDAEDFLHSNGLRQHLGYEMWTDILDLQLIKLNTLLYVKQVDSDRLQLVRNTVTEMIERNHSEPDLFENYFNKKVEGIYEEILSIQTSEDYKQVWEKLFVAFSKDTLKVIDNYLLTYVASSLV